MRLDMFEILGIVHTLYLWYMVCVNGLIIVLLWKFVFIITR